MCNYVDVPSRKSSLAKFPNYFPNLKKLKILNLSETDEEWLSSTPCPQICAKVGTVDKRNWWLENYELLSERLLALRRELEVKVSLRSELCEVEEQIQLAEYQISVLQNTWYGNQIGIKYGHVFYFLNQLGFGSDKVVFWALLSSMFAIKKKTRVQCSVQYTCTVFSLIIWWLTLKILRSDN